VVRAWPVVRAGLWSAPGLWSVVLPVAVAAPAVSSASPGMAPTANTEGVVNTHRGIAL
jgi:hypothetical protein